MTQPLKTITSTAGLTPAGVFGYAKAAAAFLSGLLAVVVQFIPADENLTRWLTGAIAVLGFIAVYAVPNAVEPTEVYDDTYGRHAVKPNPTPEV